MSNISMLSGITKGKATSCCSLAIQTSTSRSPCNAASDWAGSCAIIIEKQRDRTSKVQSGILNSDSAAAIGDRGSCGRRFATRCPNSGASVTLRHPMNYRFFRPFQYEAPSRFQQGRRGRRSPRDAANLKNENTGACDFDRHREDGDQRSRAQFRSKHLKSREHAIADHRYNK